jgi:hypothetical protein
MSALRDAIAAQLIDYYGDPDEGAVATLTASIERAVRDLLGDGHFVTFTNDRYTVEHSIDCRLGGAMDECKAHTAVQRLADRGFDPALVGRWRIASVNEDGIPDLCLAANQRLESERARDE